MSDTIAAIATGNIVSAIGIIRLSGDDSIDIVQSIFYPKSGNKITSYKDRTLVYGNTKNARGEVIDSCLCTFSHGPHSYTGENTAELQCHGSPTVLRLVLDELFKHGARQALAGEFTKRAFVNGRMDLTQAEAVIDLIESETEEAAFNAAGQLGGAIARKTDSIYNQLVDIISHYDAVLDYPDEDIEDFELGKYKITLQNAKDELESLLKSFDRGKIMKKGIKSAIVGRPNAGKSSILNALLGYERAIVTEIPGTTRDTIEETVKLGGVMLRLTDTAGLRGTDNPIEKMGVDRAKSIAKSAELVIAVFDGSDILRDDDYEAIDTAKLARRSIAIINKSDLKQKIEKPIIENAFQNICIISAINNFGLNELEKQVEKLYPKAKVPAGEILTNTRQADAVLRALDAIKSAIESLDNCVTPDIVLTEIESALNAIGELSGKTVRDDVTERIFGRFCVGK